MAFVITSQCIDIRDRLCVDQCPVECIYQGNRMLYIDPDECIDCGACAPVCPQGAIYRDEELPDAHHEFLAVNREFVAAISEGEPDPNEVYPDHPTVASAPGRDVPNE